MAANDPNGISAGMAVVIAAFFSFLSGILTKLADVVVTGRQAAKAKQEAAKANQEAAGDAEVVREQQGQERIDARIDAHIKRIEADNHGLRAELDQMRDREADLLQRIRLLADELNKAQRHIWQLERQIDGA